MRPFAWEKAKGKAALAVNTELLEANWQTGRYIVGAQWGQAPLRPFVTFLVENLVVWIKMLTFVPLIKM